MIDQEMMSGIYWVQPAERLPADLQNLDLQNPDLGGRGFGGRNELLSLGFFGAFEQQVASCNDQ